MDFEGQLFNLYTLSDERPKMLFSLRRRVVAAMLEAMKREEAAIAHEEKIDDEAEKYRNFSVDCR